MDYIAKALSNPNCLPVVDFIHETAYPIDTFMIDRFWNTINDDQLIYVDDELIKWMGYSCEELRTRKRDFMKLLKEVNEGSDYFHYSNDDYKEFLTCAIAHVNIYPPACEGHNAVKTKHLLLSPDTLKSTMMKVSTSRGDQVRKYYIDLEKLFKIYVKYQSEYEKREISNESEYKNREIAKELELAKKETESANQQIVIAQNQLAAKTTYINNIKSLIENTRPLSFKEYVYIATTDFYSTRNQFKLGKATNLKSRLSAYNTGRPEGDRYYYTYIWPTADSALLEKKITTHLRQWQDAKDREMYVINYDWLYLFTRQVCEHDRVEIEMINELVANYEAIVGREPPKVAAVNALNGVEITKLPSGLDPLPLPAPAETPAEQVQFLIASLHLTKAETIEILTSLLRPLLPGPAKSKDVNGVIRTRIGRGFKATEWKAAVKEVASIVGLSIRYR
jgi:phage anti-repressor protein